MLLVNLPLRLLLAAGVSAVALMPTAADAQSALFRGRTNNPAAAAARAVQASVNEQARARVQAQRSMTTFANAQSAISAMRAAQDAARRLALASAESVPNGLTTGGLRLSAIGRVDGTDDALAPVQTGPAEAPVVTVTQLRSRAVLTWESFNVGRETTLNFDQSTFGGTRAREWSVLNRVDDVNPSRILGRINAPGQVFVINRSGIIFGGAAEVNVGTLVASTLDVGTWDATGETRAASIARRDAAFRQGLSEYLTDAARATTPLTPNLTVTDLVPTGQPNLGQAIATARAGGDRTRFAVTVEPGARIGIAEQGFALLAGAAGAVNRGTITAASGQVHVAAGAGLRIQPVSSLPQPPTTNDARAVSTFQAPDLGYYVEVFRRPPVLVTTLIPNFDDVRAEARNEGLISTPRGSITLIGASVANTGILSSTTAANRAGSVFLIARDFGGAITAGSLNIQNLGQSAATAGASRFGEVRLGANSVIEIGTEPGADQVVFDTAAEPFRQSRIGINASLVFLDGAAPNPDGTLAPGAIVRAPAGQVRIAADLGALVLPLITLSSTIPQETARLQLVQLGSGSVIDVGGLKGVEVPVARNLIEVTVRNQNLSDQPVQRNGLLVDLANDRTSVVFDSRLGSNLFDVRGFASNVARGIAERQASGGTVDIAAERVNTLPDSLIDVSGGWIAWQGGVRPSETSLIGSDGRIYRLSNAPADLTYVGRPGLFTRVQPRWGITENYVSPIFGDRPVFEPGYIEGFDAGSISITGQPQLAGTMDGASFVGQRQARGAATNDGNRETSTDLPNGGALRLQARLRRIEGADDLGRVAANSANTSGVNIGFSINPTFVTNFGDGLTTPSLELDPTRPGALTTAAVAAGTGVNSDARVTGFLPEDRLDTRIATSTILDNGFRSIAIEAEGELLVPAGVTVALRPGGSFTSETWNARIDGTIRIPSGRIAVNANAGSRILPNLDDRDLSRRPVARPLPDGLAALNAVVERVDGVPTDGAIIVGRTAVLDVAGRFVNDFASVRAGEPETGRAFTRGGEIGLTTRFAGYRAGSSAGQTPEVPEGATVDARATPVFGHDILLSGGAVLDVSGGAYLARGTTQPAPQAAAAGAIAVTTYAGFNQSPTGSAVAVPPVPPTGGFYPGRRNYARDERYSTIFDAGAEYRGFALGRESGAATNGRGGSIALTAPLIAIGAGAAADGIAFDPDRFAAAGFATFRATATNAGGQPYLGLPTGTLTIAPGTLVAPLPRNRVFSTTYGALPTGTPLETLGAPGLLPQADRAAVNLLLTAQNRLELGRRETPGATPTPTTLIADPGAAAATTGAAIELTAGRPIFLDGTLEAPGGRIVVTGTGRATEVTLSPGIFSSLTGATFQRGEALWVAAGARLSVAGFAQSTVDRFGVIRATARPGGSIELTERTGYLVVEAATTDLPAAQLDISGTSATVSELRTIGLGPRIPATTTVASAAGSIALSGESGLFLDGTLVAQPGGAGAAGGTLNIVGRPTFVIDDPNFVSTRPLAQGSAVPLAPSDLDPRGVIVVRDNGGRPNLPTAALAAKTDPNAAIDVTLVRTDSGWTGGADTARAYLDPAVLVGSGIDRVNLLERPVVVEGSPNLSVARMLQLPGQIILRPARVPDAPPPNARLTAPYVVIETSSNSVALPADLATRLAGALTIAASGQLDLVGFDIRGAEQVVLESAGAIRFTTLPLGAVVAPQTTAGATPIRRLGTTQVSQGNLTLRSGQVYVDTGLAATVRVTRRDGDPEPDATRPETIPTITIASLGGSVPETPIAAGGRLTLNANRIVQGGVLRAPQGELVFQGARRANDLPSSVSFLPGSVTSVAAGGRRVPFGQSRSDQTALGIEIYDALYNLQSGTGANIVLQPALDGSPARSLTLTADGIDVQAGASVDLSGDGELLAYRFVAGPGGSRDVLARGTVNDTGSAYTAFQFSDRRDVFAIVPGAQDYGAPRSPYIRDSGDSLGRGDVTTVGTATGTAPSVGDQIEIGPGVPGLPAGRYTLLPARYAIMPGGYQLVMGPAGTGLAAATPLDSAVVARDGRVVVGGFRTVAGTGLRESQQRLITLRPPEVWQSLSQIVVDSHSAFFTQRAAVNGTPPPRLPIDGGRLTVIDATRQLVLDGDFRFATGPGGRGGQVEIAADRLAVAPRNRILTTVDGSNVVIGADGAVRTDLAGFLPVAAEALSALGAESLILGGRRNSFVTVEGVRDLEAEGIYVAARNIQVTEGAAVTAPELILVAGRLASQSTDGPPTGIVLEAGSLVGASGAPVIGGFAKLAIGDRFVVGSPDETTGDDLPRRPGAAIVRVTTGNQVEILRPDALAADTPLAQLTLGAGSTVAAPTAAIDLVGTGALADSVTFAVGNLFFGSPRIVLGTPPTPIAGAITFGQGVLARLAGVNTLTLQGKGAEPIDVFGAAALATAARINLDAPGLRANDGASLFLTAGIVELGNTRGAGPPAAVSGGGALAIAAPGEFRFGAGNFALASFGTVTVDAGVVVAAGTGSLALGAPLSVTTGRVIAEAGADATLTTPGAITLAGTPVAGPPTIGGRLVLSGGSLTLGTRIESLGGSIELAATAGDLTLLPGSAVDARGVTVAFFDVNAYVGAGTVRLDAPAGAITVGGVIDVSASDLGVIEAEAGRVAFAAGGAAVFAAGGAVRGFAAPGGISGSFAFEGSGAVDLPSINSALDAGGFFESRVITAGIGNLVVEAGRTMTAREVVLTANAGAVVVGGTIDAGGAKGGTIELWARDLVRLEAGGLITALNAEAGRRGGTISVGTTAGPLELLGSIAAYRPGDSDPLYGGRVRLRLPSGVAGNIIEPTRIAARRAEVSPFVVLDTPSGVISPSAIASAFGAVPINGFSLPVVPEVVVSNPGGNLVLPEGQPIALQSLRTAAGEGGVLTFLSGNNLEILANISDGFTTADATGRLLADRRGWSLRLVAGAAGGANPLGTRQGTGDVLIGEQWNYSPRVLNSATSPATLNNPPPTKPVLIRTGVGSIEIGAAGNIAIRDPDSVVYTAGRAIEGLVEETGVDSTGQTVVTARYYTQSRFDPASGQTVVDRFYVPLDATFIEQPSRPPPGEIQATATVATYPIEGGDLRLNAGGDITSTVLLPLTGTTGSFEGLYNVGQTASQWLQHNGLALESGSFAYRPFVERQFLFGSGNTSTRPLVDVPAQTTQSTWYVDFRNFAQNFGVLGGGNASIAAGGDWQGSISIPTTARTFGGLPDNYQYTYRATSGTGLTTVSGAVPASGSAANLVVSGGGDLAFRVGGNVRAGSQFLVGRGEARISVAGSLLTAEASIGTFDQSFPVATVLALGDSRYRVAVGGSATFGTYDVFQYRAASSFVNADSWGFGGFRSVPRFSTLTERTRVDLLATSGDVTLLATTGSLTASSLSPTIGGQINSLGASLRRVGNANQIRNLPVDFENDTEIRSSLELLPNDGVRLGLTAPTQFSVTAAVGDVILDNIAIRAPLSEASSLRLLAGGDLVFLGNSDRSLNTVGLLAENRQPSDLSTPLQPRQTAFTQGVVAATSGNPRVTVSPDGQAYLLSVSRIEDPATSLRANDQSRDIVYALGDITGPNIGFLPISQATLIRPYAKRIGIRAGGDITDAAIYLQHAAEGDLSFVRAGRDIGTTLRPGEPGYGNVFEIGGPGRLQIISGRTIFAIREPVLNEATTGRFTGGTLNGIRSIGNARNILLPEGGAALDVLFGVGPGQGIDVDGFLGRALDAANPVGTYRVEIGSILRQDGGTAFRPGTLQANGGALWFIQPDATTDPATIALVDALPQPERLALAIDLYFRELTASGREAVAASGPRQGSYQRGFDAIASLFPNRPEYAGNLNIQNNFIRTEQGGDINVLGPGGDFLIGAVAGGRAGQSQLPDRFGVLTLGFGNINLFTDGDIAAGESRIVTLDGGDVTAWSSTRDISAGLGARTARFVPQFRVGYLPNLVQVPDRAGQITGSGISTFTPFTPIELVEPLRRAPASETEAFAQLERRRRSRQPLTDAERTRLGVTSTGPQVNLIAPVGTVDFGDAGVTVAGDLLVAALTVANASNANVGGASVGVPSVAAPNVAGALAAASTAGAANQASEAAAAAARGQGQQPQQRPRTLTARVVGWGDTEEEALRPR